MSATEEIESRFLKDIKGHQLEIIRDDGVYRHVKCRTPGTYCYSFEIITWPGWLCYTGDMGSYTFQRLEDMFEFFRCRVPSASRKLQINTGYWAEKVQAADKHGKIQEFDADKFRSRLLENINDRDFEDEDAAELKAALTSEVLDAVDDLDERGARDLADSFTFKGREVFHDLWDFDFQEYTHHFVWCCYAIAWTILKYDALKSEPVADAIRAFGGKVEGGAA
ncbi:MAG: hypothetical protein ACOYM3_22100 [Terrimicrobiaceae bacterium]